MLEESKKKEEMRCEKATRGRVAEKEEGAESKLLVAVDLDTRVAGVVLGKDGARGRETLGVLVKEDLAVVLDELALPEDAVHLGPAAGTAFELDTSLGETLAESIGSFPSVSQKLSFLVRRGIEAKETHAL